jgi:hypothetical protein
MRGFGSMISFELMGGFEAGVRRLRRAHLPGWRRMA